MRVTTSLVVAITAVAVVLGLLGTAATLARRRIGLLHLAGAAALEALLLIQSAAVAVAMLRGYRPADVPTFLSYLVAVTLVPVAGTLWARSEQTRWAGTVLAVAAGVVAVMVWRLLQLWEASGA